MSSWRMIHKKDGTNVLRSPEGKEYRGTASEIRGAALMPDNRKSLAEHLRSLRHSAALSELSADERREERVRARLDALKFDAFDFWHDCRPVGIPNRLAIEAAAAARSQGMTLADFVAQWVEAGIEAAKDDAPGGDIQLTRHERAALARIEGKGVAA